MKNKILDIITDKKKIRSERLIIIDTEKILKDLLEAKFTLKYFLHSGEFSQIAKKYAIKDNIIKVKPSIINKFSDVETSQGFIAVFQIPENNKVDINKEKKIILFDTIQNPSNAGAIIRSGTAFGFDSYLFLDSVYIFNGKSIRSSAGTCFMIKYADIVIDDIKNLKKKGFDIIATDVEKGKDVKQISNYFNGKFVLVFGNEGYGIRDEILNIVDAKVKIDYPNKKVESLNVAVAAGILFYEINKLIS